MSPLPPPPRSARSPAPLLSDLLEQVLLARLLRAGPASFRPERLVAGVIAVVLLGSAFVVVPPVLGAPDLVPTLIAAVGLVPTLVSEALSPTELTAGLRFLLLDTPAGLFAEAPLASALLTLITVATLATAGLFICRSVGMELGRGIHLRASRGLLYIRLKSAAAGIALVFPLAIVAVLLLTPLVAGLLLSVPGLDAVGALLYGLAMLAGIAAALILIAAIPATTMILPAVACDGSDAFDAVQRALSIVLGRPLTFLLHAGVAVAQGVLLTAVVWIVLDLGTALAGAAAGLPSARAEAVIGAAGWNGLGVPSFPVAALALWTRLPAILAAAFAVSYIHTAATAVYLNMRLIIDGQEANELWMPGDPAGSSTRPEPASSDVAAITESKPDGADDIRQGQDPAEGPAAAHPGGAAGSLPPQGSREGQPA